MVPKLTTRVRFPSPAPVSRPVNLRVGGLGLCVLSSWSMPSALPRLLLTTALLLAACVENAGPVEPYAFVGRWDCGVSVFTFTNTTYNNGSETFAIQHVARNGRDYTLRFTNGYVVALGAVTATGFTWVSGNSGDQFNCARVN
jgi:hypothetical protein